MATLTIDKTSPLLDNTPLLLNETRAARRTEPSGWTIVHHCLAEFLATMLFIFMGCAIPQSVYYVSRDTPDIDPAAEITLIAIVHGMLLLALIVALGSVSNAHLNPVVSLAFFIADDSFKLISLVVYSISQILGGILGCVLLKAVYPMDVLRVTKYGAHKLGPDITIANGLILEIILTFILILVIMRAALDANAVLAPLAVGFTVASNIMVGAKITGASMNPARSFASAVVAEDAWKNNWIYWLGPYIGSALAATVYRFVFNSKTARPWL